MLELLLPPQLQPRYRYKIHDKLYDLTDFVKVHPGGQDMFNNLKTDTNITPMIYAYHKNPKSILAMLPKYEVLSTDARTDDIIIQYDTNYTYDKYCELKKLVYDEIHEKKIPLYWSNKEIAYNAFMFSMYLWMLIYFYLNPNTITFGYIFLLSIIRVGSPGAMFHETAHYIGFKNQKINKWLSDFLLLDIFIANEWRIRHNYIHHSFTNTIYDEDLHKVKLAMRYSPLHELLFNHRFQHNIVYLSVIFCLNAIVKAFYKKIIWGDIQGFIFNCISLYIVGYKYIIFMCISAIQYTFIAQLSHIHHECIQLNNENKNDFLYNQVSSSMNYRTDDFITRFLAMTLDIQIEHHLFPNIPTSSLRQIQHIVRGYCEKNDILYIEKPSIFPTIYSYICYLYKMGNP